MPFKFVKPSPIVRARTLRSNRSLNAMTDIDTLISNNR
ncbi:MAG TPA: carbonate dehydratase, partial [Pantoea sp.]|nr:carbonate dehydratase [Pantoea sp.]